MTPTREDLKPKQKNSTTLYNAPYRHFDTDSTSFLATSMRKSDLVPHYPLWLDSMLADIAALTALNYTTSSALTISTWPARLSRKALEK